MKPGPGQRRPLHHSEISHLWALWTYSQHPLQLPSKHALTGPELGRCYRHRPSSGSVKAGHGMFIGLVWVYSQFWSCSPALFKLTACQLINEKLLCYSQASGLLLPKLVRLKNIPKGVYSNDKIRQPCLYFIGSEDVSDNTVQAPVPLSIFRSNSKFDENSECSSFEYTRPITTIFCTRHDSDTVVTCAKYRCDSHILH